MSSNEILARIILRPNGSVHIAFRNVRSIYATATNISELFSNPINFIEIQSYKYQESTFEINRKRVALEDVLGLTLAKVTADKQIVCDFPELFQFMFSNAESNPETKLNMKSFETESILSDEKSFLLRYYLEFTNHLTSVLTIQNNIRLRNEVQCEIIREILNTFFIDTLPEDKKTEDLSSRISKAENSVVFDSISSENEMVGVYDYANIVGLAPQTIHKYISEKRIKTAIKISGKWMINKNDRPIDWDLRKGKKRKTDTSGKVYKRRNSGSAEDVRKHILKLDLFSNQIAQYIHTYEELDYYTKRHYHEVCWDGQPAIIIDVNPEYVSNKGIKNRDLLAKGKPPHIPNRDKDEFVYHIHHIGQNTTSPFAIIPEYDHNGIGLSSVFHQGSPNGELHGPEFEIAKSNFWKNYLEEYDKAGRFDLIEYSNPKSKRNKK